jgi:hypothetical protein
MSSSASSSMDSNFDFSVYSKTLGDLYNRLCSGRIIIPPHQRNYVWDLIRQTRLIEAIIRRRALTGTILLRLLSDGKFSLEDGQQRLTTVKRFIEDQFKIVINGEEKNFKDLTDVQKQAFLAFSIPVEQYEGATDAEAIDIFVQRQGGAPLSTGDKLYAMKDLSKIVEYAIKTLLKKNTGLHERAKLVWGAQDGPDKKRTRLLTSVALCSALAFGPNFMTRKWPDYQTSGILSNDVDESMVTDMLEKILTILENVQEAVPVNGKSKKKQWDPGFVTGYIACDLWSRSQHPDRSDMHEEAITRWTEFLIRARQDPTNSLIEKVLHPQDDSARSWLAARWFGGVSRMYEYNLDDEPQRIVPTQVNVEIPTSTDDDDDDYEDAASEESE